ncbi:MAG: hypothetical protein KKC51_03250, partial [Verrucomicrobia bacterium]|nr:hypothetical protein [Verrucomicrobiota bacterium]
MAIIDPYVTTGEHRFHATRRRLKKTALVMLLVGLVSLVLGAVVLVYGLFLARVTARGRMLAMAGIYSGGGLLCLLIRWPLESFR